MQRCAPPGTVGDPRQQSSCVGQGLGHIVGILNECQTVIRVEVQPVVLLVRDHVALAGRTAVHMQLPVLSHFIFIFSCIGAGLLKVVHRPVRVRVGNVVHAANRLRLHPLAVAQPPVKSAVDRVFPLLVAVEHMV